jgi:O-antigen/teichoic acid export membrane protein
MLKRLKQNQLARNTLSTFVGMIMRVGIQGVYFVLIARSLGNKGYGAFIGTVSLVALLAPFSSLGCGNLLVKNVARDPKLFRVYWGNGILTTLVSGGFLIGLAVLLSTVLLPKSVSMLMVMLIAFSDILFARLLDFSGQAYQAYQRLSRTAQFQVLLSVCRLLSALVLQLVVEKPEPLDWGWFYLLSTSLSAMVALRLACRELGMPKTEIRRIFGELKEGFYFAVGLSAQSIYNDLDKTLLTRLSTLEVAGIYAAGYRIIDVAFTPVRSLLYAAYARFFQHGTDGIKGSLRFAKKLLPMAMVYGMIVGTSLYLIAPFVPFILGPEYTASVDAIRLLAFLPLLRSIHYFAADTLTGSGHQGIRSGVQVFVTVTSLVLNSVLIPLYTWRGAAMVAITTDFLLIIGLWGAVWGLSKHATASAKTSLVVREANIE